MSTPITFERKVKVELVDANGQAIHKGSVLQHIKEKDTRGVVTRIALPEMGRSVICEMVGDVHIRTSCACHRVTQKYQDYKHIPHDEQTYEERYYSWVYGEFYYDEDLKASEIEQLAMSGVIALLPDNAIDWTYKYHNSIDDVLKYLMKHLMELKEKADKNDKT